MKHIKTLSALLVILLAGNVAAQQQQTERPTVNLNATLINTDPVPLQNGEDGDVRIKIRNTGNTESEDVSVSVVDQYPFELKPDRQRTRELGRLAPGQEYQFLTEVQVAEDASDGSQDLRVRIESRDITRNLNVPVEVQSDDIELNVANLRSSPSTLRPDTEDVTLNLNVVNNGDKTAENVQLDLGLPDSFERTSSFSSTESLGNLASGETKTGQFSFDISENATNGPVSVPTELSYSASDSTTEITQESSFEVFLDGRPQYEIVEANADLRQGATGEVELTVRNTGSEESTSTRVRVLDSSDLPFSYASASQFVGTLEPGQSGTAVFEVTAESDADVKQYLLDFEVRGVKNSEVFTEDTTVPVEVSAGASDSSGISPTLIAGALVAVLLIAAFIFRSRLNNLFDGNPAEDLPGN